MRNIIAIIDEVLACDWSVSVNMLCGFKTLAYTRMHTQEYTIYLYTLTHKPIHKFIYAYVYTYRYISVYTYIQVFCNVYMQDLHTCMHIRNINKCFCKCMHAYICTYIHMYICICTCVYVCFIYVNVYVYSFKIIGYMIYKPIVYNCILHMHAQVICGYWLC